MTIAYVILELHNEREREREKERERERERERESVCVCVCVSYVKLLQDTRQTLKSLASYCNNGP